ncbi:expressed unknown protein [Seminavis robusta]|uniref:PDZ domain-containing protein n=1 Tax=Seminavis robusta TaxID=568900 RepID=A0A9N8DY49_9STRA|nr:expressed unknown protein [Seminavis robusta]|eukprot:Sro438_g143010.1 n/a (213) ;mRNA; r:26698-27433
MSSILTILTLLAGAANLSTAFVTNPSVPKSIPSTTACHAQFDSSSLWNRGLNFGKSPFNFYLSFERWMSPFPEEDQAAFPEIFSLPKGVYEVDLDRPLGIVFEEIEVGKGLYVQELVEGGNAERNGNVKVGDNLVGITAVKIVGAKYERRMIPCRGFDFDTMVGAVSSNDPKWGCDGVVILLERPDEADRAKVDDFLAFFEPPFDTAWKQQQ